MPSIGEPIIILFCGVLISAGSGAAWADDIPACPVPEGMNSVAIPDGVPEGLRSRLGTIAPPGAQFDATDVVRTGISRRYIFVWRRDNHWIVATEQGGRGYNDPIMAYVLIADGNFALVGKRISAPQLVCLDALALTNE
jgi:hypothetical protein